MITRYWAEGGAALKVSWSIFGNTEMYHLCVQYISSRNREESALGPVVPLDTISHGISQSPFPEKWLTLILNIPTTT